jgi:hypothetical protein
MIKIYNKIKGSLLIRNQQARGSNPRVGSTFSMNI